MGHKPSGKAGFEALRARGVRTILNLESMPWDIWPERRQALCNGLEFRNVPILAAPLAPREERVREALLILTDPLLQPVFVHCYLGEDRSNFIIGLYRVYFQGWTPQAAWNEMLRSGFHTRFTLRGLSAYFWRHSATPDWAESRRPVAEKGLPKGSHLKAGSNLPPLSPRFSRAIVVCSGENSTDELST